MPGGIHPPIEVLFRWPAPNYVDPVTQTKYVLLLSCILGPVSIVLLCARLWVRFRIQRNAGLDDWLMLASMVPTTALTILLPIVVENYRFNRHVWDIEPKFFPIQRKFIMATYCLFSLSSGLIKVSVLLFYRRLSARAVTSTSRWIIHATMFSIFGYTVAFSIVPIFACSPISAFWNQVDFGRTLQAGGYHYNCINEGADLLANGIISTVQDFIAALLPTLLCWRLQITIRQKIALYSVFAISYSTVAIGAVRTYTGYRIFFTTYDVTWLASEMWLWTLLELHIGSMCANTPALKVFFGTMLQSERFTSWTRSWHTRSGSSHHRRSRGNSASKQRTWLKNKLGASTNTNDTSTAGSHQLVDWKGQGYNTSANRDPRGDIRQDPHNSFSRPFRPEFREVIIDSGPQSPSDRDIETASFASFVSLYNTKHVS